MAEILGLKEAINNLQKIAGNFQDQQRMHEAGLRAQRYIKKRTREGRDVDGAPFKAYSKAHKKTREKLGLPTTIVNLQMNDIDGMMVSVDHTVNRSFTQVHVFIKGRRSENGKTFTNMQLMQWQHDKGREAFGLNDDEGKKITRYIADDIKKFILHEATNG